MTEAEWLGCSDPRELWKFLGPAVSDRKLRLFQVACCRRIWDLLPGDVYREATCVGEQYADRLVRYKVCLDMRRRVQSIDHGVDVLKINAANAALHTLNKTLFRSAEYLGSAVVSGRVAVRAAHGSLEAYKAAYQLARAAEAALVRCVIGDPFRPIPLDPAWQTATVVALAQGMYESRAFDRMSILADALQDADCDNDVILDHCRGPGPHVRGCWVVDLILGKE